MIFKTFKAFHYHGASDISDIGFLKLYCRGLRRSPLRETHACQVGKKTAFDLIIILFINVVAKKYMVLYF